MTMDDAGYVDCACRDCFEIAIGTWGKALCSDCEESGCEAGAEQECCADGAYGVDDDEPEWKAQADECWADAWKDHKHD